jgi:hypothetical protein
MRGSGRGWVVCAVPLLVVAVLLVGRSADAEQEPPFDFGPVPLTEDQDVLLGVFFPPRLPPPEWAGQKDPPWIVHLRLLDEAGAVLGESSQAVVAGQGAALEVPGTEIFEQREPPYIVAQVAFEHVHAGQEVAQHTNPPWLPSLQLLDAVTGAVELVLSKEPPYLPPPEWAEQREPPYLPPLAVTESDEVVFSYAGVGGEVVAFSLWDRTGAEVHASGALEVPEGGSLVHSLDGATVLSAWTPPFVVGRVEVLEVAEQRDPPWVPASASLAVLSGTTGRARALGVLGISQSKDPPFRPGDGGWEPPTDPW